MFETASPWDEFAAMIEAKAELAKAELRLMADRARDDLDIRLGFSKSFIRRSKGQRRRYERQRLQRIVA